MQVTVVGAGNMGRGIGARFVAGGHELSIVDPDAEKAQQLAVELGERAIAAYQPHGEVIVLAVPYEAVPAAVEEHRAACVGRIVVDIANPADWATMDRTVTPDGSSSAEETAALLPESRVVKAFNTTFAATLSAGTVAGQPLDVLIAGDDAEAKVTVAQLVTDGGMRPLDVGPLRRARQLEQLGLLHIAAQTVLGTSFASAVKIIW